MLIISADALGGVWTEGYITETTGQSTEYRSQYRSQDLIDLKNAHVFDIQQIRELIIPIEFDHVVPSFIELLDLIPSDVVLDDFLNYFMTIWIQRVA